MVHRLFKAVINNIAALRKERMATLSAIFHESACEISEQFLQTLHYMNQPKFTEGHQVSDICFSGVIYIISDFDSAFGLSLNYA